ncbi:CBS domain-containing protein [Myxococcus sp. K15C18031901]|uniref:CBS domain-containing protein n=1 Tax=Myxococcus dinghuensis TaxID=2906761 RepID=UPI0020A80FA1|nr:CBS domain-containing protein [Myxococcus dinghuensis]MCP3104130.1 CBS domain-containing protein [Myxococcus dinghuensis]
MAQRLDNGRDDSREARRQGVEQENSRPVDAAPPGSRERGESDLTGWNPARDEEPSLREGRFHRAAQLRMAQVRTDIDDRDASQRRSGRGPEWATGGVLGGPYGLDDRDDRYADGRGPRAIMGDHDEELSPQRAEFRPWNRRGYGPEDAPREDARYQGRDPGGEVRRHGGGPSHRKWMHEGRPGGGEHARGSPMRGDAEAHEYVRPLDARGSGWSVRERHHDRDPRERDERTFVADHLREDRSQDFRMTASGRRGWRREPLTAGEVMTRNVRTVRRNTPLRDVARIMKDEDCGVVPIVDSLGRLEGIVTDRDLAVRAFMQGRPVEQLQVSDVMTDDVEAVTSTEDLHGVLVVMGQKQVRRLPVVERDDRVIGIISLGDIAQRADDDEALQETLERISARRSFWTRLR